MKSKTTIFSILKENNDQLSVLILCRRYVMSLDDSLTGFVWKRLIFVSEYFQVCRAGKGWYLVIKGDVK